MKRIKKFILLILLFLYPTLANAQKEQIVEHITNLSKEDSSKEYLIIDDSDDKNIRYIGENPNNYVIFNNELWRIIGVMNNIEDENGNYESKIKIIRNNSLGEYSWDTKYSKNGNYGINEWSTSDLMKELNGDYLNDELTQNTKWTTYYLDNKDFDYTLSIDNTSQELIEESVFYLGEISWYDMFSEKVIKTASKVYSSERTKNLYLNEFKTDEKGYWLGKVGLMYLSDYLYATSGGPTKTREECINDIEISTYPRKITKSECIANNYLFSGKNWTINSVYSDYTNFYIDEYGYIHYNYEHSYQSYGVKPTVYLKENVEILSGDGSEENPYILGYEKTIEITINKSENILNLEDYLPLETINENNLYNITDQEIASVESKQIILKKEGYTEISIVINSTIYKINLNIVNDDDIKSSFENPKTSDKLILLSLILIILGFLIIMKINKSLKFIEN